MDTSGNVKFELIDNPYMDRPEDFGFDGWKSNETYTITTNNSTKVQTLTAGTTNKKATINKTNKLDFTVTLFFIIT